MKLFHNEIDLQINFKSKAPQRCLIKAHEKIYQYLIKTNNDDDIIAINKGRVCKLNETFEQLRDFHNDNTLIILEVFSLQSLYDQNIQLRIEKKEIEIELKDVEFGFRKLQERFRVEVIQLEEHIKSSKEKDEKFGQNTVNSEYFPSQFKENENESQLLSESQVEIKYFCGQHLSGSQKFIQNEINISSIDNSTKFLSTNCLQCLGNIGNQRIALECQHNFHFQCLNNIYSEQLSNNLPYLTCPCGRKINTQILRDSKEDWVQKYYEQLMLNQLDAIQKSSNEFKTIFCENQTCKYFYFVKNNDSLNNQRNCPFCQEN